MQATPIKQLVVSRGRGIAIALGALIAGTIIVIILSVDGSSSVSRTDASVRALPEAYGSIGQGEGLVDAANTRISAVAPLKAYVSPFQGEGLVDTTNRPAAGSVIQSHLGYGQGEGLVGPGGSADRSMLNPTRSTVKVYPTAGHGDGLIGPGESTERSLLDANE